MQRIMTQFCFLYRTSAFLRISLQKYFSFRGTPSIFFTHGLPRGPLPTSPHCLDLDLDPAVPTGTLGDEWSSPHWTNLNYASGLLQIFFYFRYYVNFQFQSITFCRIIFPKLCVHWLQTKTGTVSYTGSKGCHAYIWLHQFHWRRRSATNRHQVYWQQPAAAKPSFLRSTCVQRWTYTGLSEQAGCCYSY